MPQFTFQFCFSDIDWHLGEFLVWALMNISSGGNREHFFVGHELRSGVSQVFFGNAFSLPFHTLDLCSPLHLYLCLSWATATLSGLSRSILQSTCLLFHHSYSSKTDMAWCPSSNPKTPGESSLSSKQRAVWGCLPISCSDHFCQLPLTSASSDTVCWLVILSYLQFLSHRWR